MQTLQTSHPLEMVHAPLSLPALRPSTAPPHTLLFPLSFSIELDAVPPDLWPRT